MVRPGEEVRFTTDSAVEGEGFEPSVPRRVRSVVALCPPVACQGWGRRSSARRGSARFPLLGEPFHAADGPFRLAGLRFPSLLGGLRAHPHEFVKPLAPKRPLGPVEELGG